MELQAIRHHRSYQNYLQGLLGRWPEFRWLCSFLGRTVTEPATQVTILDITNELIESKVVTAAGPTLDSALKHSMGDQRTKVIMIAYVNEEDLDRQIIDQIAWLYDVDPIFLWRHFDRKRQPNDLEMLTSKQRNLAIGHHDYEHASIYFLPENTERSNITKILILLQHPQSCKASSLSFERPSRHLPDRTRSIGSSMTLSKRYVAVLEHQSSTELATANEMPMLLLCPLIHLMTLETSVRIAQEIRALDSWSQKAMTGGRQFVRWELNFESDLYEYCLRMHRDAIIRSLNSLIHFRSLSLQTEILEYSHPSGVKILISDLQEVLKVAEKGLRWFYTIESRSIAHRGIADSLTTMERSESIGQVTTLAFIFIPLSFVTSVFGMNVQEFGSGPVSLRNVAKFGILIASVVALLWFLSGPIYRSVHALYRNIEGVGFRRRVLLDFAYISPAGAFWLLIFGITHDPEIFAPLVTELGIWSVLGLGKEWERPTIHTSKQISKLSGFWQTRANNIAEITKVPGWQRVSYLQQRRVRTPHTLHPA